MSRTPDQVQDEMFAILTTGWAIPTERDTFGGTRYRPMALEWAAIEASAEAMLPETNPIAAKNLLPDYENVLGPDPFGRNLAADTVAQRQAIAFQRWTGVGIMCAGYFVRLGAQLGETLTIEEFPLFECGAAECGTEPVPWPVHLQFVVHLPATFEWFAECGALEAGEPTSGSVANFMEAIVRQEAPLHTLPVFYYS